MSMMLALSSFITFTGYVNFFPFMNKSGSKMPKDDIWSPEAETQLCGSDIFMALNV